MKDIKSSYQNLLDTVRNNPNEIQNFNCIIENETDRPIDKNELERFRLSIAIYNDFRNEDERIIDHLIKEQIIAMKRANLFISESYHLLGYLYSKNKNPKKVELFYELKTLNYDTFCGFDREHLFVNGIKETYDYLNSIEPEYAERIKKEMGQTYEESLFTETDIENWKKYKNDYFYPLQYPKTLNEEIDFYLQSKEIDNLRYVLSNWYTETKDWSMTNLSKLINSLKQINDSLLSIQYLEPKSNLYDGEVTNQILINYLIDCYLTNGQEVKATRLIESKIGLGENNYYEDNLVNKLFLIHEQSTDPFLKNEIEKQIEKQSKIIEFGNSNKTNYNKLKNNM